MTRSEKREWLWRLREIEPARRALGERYIRTEERLFACQELLKRCGTEKGRARLMASVRQCQGQMRKMDIQWARYEEIRMEVTRAISEVEDPVARKMMRARYLEGKSWKEIARNFNYCDSSVYLKHKRALDRLGLTENAAA